MACYILNCSKQLQSAIRSQLDILAFLNNTKIRIHFSFFMNIFVFFVFYLVISGSKFMHNTMI
jgi:hypothetical protein